MLIAIVGANGQLGSDVTDVVRDGGHEPVPLLHADVDVTELASVRHALDRWAPDVVINTAAMNHVERCEQEPELAFLVNAVGARNLALTTAVKGIPFLHVSTDYVFDGTRSEPYVETDTPSPLNAYGTSKLAGEHFVRALNARHFIVRTSALYGAHPCRAKPHDNFVRTMLRRGREGLPLRVVSDERVSPTWTGDLSRQIMRLIETGAYGTYHATSHGGCSWFEFAQAIFEEAGLKVEVNAVSSIEYGSEVRRPPQSVLDNSALRRLGCDVMPHWRDALRGFLRESGEIPAQ